MSKQFVNDVARIAILATCWHEVPMPPLEGEVPNEREAEGFVRQLSKNPSVSPFGLPAFNRGMIATGNHNFEKFAALCNTLSGEPRRLRRSGRQVGDPYVAHSIDNAFIYF